MSVVIQAAVDKAFAAVDHIVEVGRVAAQAAEDTVVSAAGATLESVDVVYDATVNKAAEEVRLALARLQDVVNKVVEPLP